MGIRAFDSLIVGFVLITLVYLGSFLLIIDIPTFNPVNPESVYMVLLSMFFGLAFGLFAGSWFTKEQLKILVVKNELHGLGSKRFYVALFLGLALFLFCSFFAVYYRIPALVYSLTEFVVSGAFTMYISRMIIIQKWERKSGKMVMVEWNKFYLVSNPFEKTA